MKLSNRVNEKTFDIKNALSGILYILLVLFSFAFFAWLAENIPYTQDDWEWGLQKGMDHLLKADINSRYTGNSIEILLTRIEAFKIWFMAVIFTIIPVMLVETANYGIAYKSGAEKNAARIVLFLFCSAIIFSMPKLMWRQTYGWVAGFANYVVSIPAILGYILVLLRLSENRNISRRKQLVAGVLLFLFGALVQMFIENLTLYFVLISVLYLVIMRLTKQKINPLFWALASGCIVGCVTMFSSGVYQVLFSEGQMLGGLRQLNFGRDKSVFGMCLEILEVFFVEFVPRMTSGNAFISCLTILLLMIKRALMGKKTVGSAVMLLFELCFAAYYAYCFSLNMALKNTIIFSPLINIAFIVIVTAETVMLYRHTAKRLFWMLFIWLSSFAVMAPLAAVVGWGDRNFITCYVFNVLYCVVMLAEIWRVFADKKASWRAAVFAVCILGFAFQTGRYFLAYREIGSVNWEREVLIEGAINGEYDRILMPTYVHWRYLWGQDPRSPKDKSRTDCFREFYSIPNDVELWFETWGDPPEVWDLGTPS